jgi:uncharacterized protein YciI
MNETEKYFVIIRPPRTDFADNMTPEETIVMEEHFGYLQSLLEKDKLLLAGPCVDGAFGVIILNVNSYLEAEILMNNDPSVKAKIMTPEIHPFRISLLKT